MMMKIPPQNETCLNLQQDRILGRNAEESVLLNAYFAALSSMNNDGTPASIILIQGDSGVGKTKLAETLGPHVQGDDGFFIRGKFDQITSHNGSASVPYSGIAPAFCDYCSQLEQRGEEALDEVAHALKSEIREEDGIFLLQAIPGLEKIISRGNTQPNGVSHSSKASSGDGEFTENGLNRLKYLLKKFIQVISKMGDPIVVLVDDLQWADKSSLNLLKTLVVGAKNPFIFVFTYRPVESDHPFKSLLDKLEKNAVPKTEIVLHNLATDAFRDLVSNILDIDQANRCSELSDLIGHVTKGNPLFARQQIISLFDHGLISFDGKDYSWDIGKIKAKTSALRDVTNIISEKLLKLPVLTQNALIICACIGQSVVDLFLLGLLIKSICPPENCECVDYETIAKNAVAIATREGLLVPTRDKSGVAFGHDSVKSASYNLLEEENRAPYHLNIAQTMRQHLSSDLLQKYLFTIAGQLGLGSDLITKRDDQIDAATIFVQAGIKSRIACAFSDAQFFLKRAVAMLCDEDWNKNHQLCCDAYINSARAASLARDFEYMDFLLNIVLEKTRDSPYDQFCVHCLRISSLTARLKYKEALDLGCEVLKRAGEEFPSRNLTVCTLIEFAKTRQMMKGKNAAELLKLPPIQDKQIFAILRLMHRLIPLTLATRPTLTPFLCFRIVQLNLKHGMSDEMPKAIALYTTILMRFRCSPSEASKHAQTALEIQDHQKCKEAFANVTFLIYSGIFSYTRQLRDSLQPLNNGYESGMKYGDTFYAHQCALNHGWLAFHSGQPLKGVSKLLVKISRSLTEHNSLPLLNLNEVYQHAVKNFLGDSESDCNLAVIRGAFFGKQPRDKNILFRNHAKFIQMLTAFFFDDFELAWKMSETISPNDFHSKGILYYVCMFYRGMSAFAMLQISRNRLVSATAKACLKLLREGSKKSPINLKHQHLLLLAENFASKKRYRLAEKYFSSALQQATSSGPIHELALVYERFGLFYLSRKMHDRAYVQVKESFALYSKWGSKSKCDHLKRRFPHLGEIRRGSDQLVDTDRSQLQGIPEFVEINE